MKASHRCLIIVTVVLLALVGAAVAVVTCLAHLEDVGKANVTGNEVRKLGSRIVTFMFMEDPPLSKPREENARALYAWLMAPPRGEDWFGGEPAWPFDNVVGTLRDSWGRELVFRCPSRRKEAIFDLYSVGPNGIDEQGNGDDITCGTSADFEACRSLFKNGLIDLGYVRSHMDDLKRDSQGVVGTP
jgi:hypothetical protein